MYPPISTHDRFTSTLSLSLSRFIRGPVLQKMKPTPDPILQSRSRPKAAPGSPMTLIDSRVEANVCLCVRASRRAWQTSRERINGKEERNRRYRQRWTPWTNRWVRERDMESEKRRDRNSAQPWRETLIAATCYLFVFAQAQATSTYIPCSSMLRSMFERNLNEVVCICGTRVELLDHGFQRFTIAVRKNFWRFVTRFDKVINNRDVSLKILIV